MPPHPPPHPAPAGMPAGWSPRPRTRRPIPAMPAPINGTPAASRSPVFPRNGSGGSGRTGGCGDCADRSAPPRPAAGPVCAAQRSHSPSARSRLRIACSRRGRAARSNRARARALALIDQPPRRLPVPQHPLDAVLRGHRLEHLHRPVALARIEQREAAPVAGHPAVQTRQLGSGPPTAQRMDHQRQRHLVEPGVERLQHQLLRRIVADRQRIGQEPRPEHPRAAVEEPPGVEVEIALPVFVGLAPVERAVEVQPEAVVEGAPDLPVARPVGLDLRPGALPPHRGRRPLPGEGNRRQVAGDQRVRVEEQEGLVRRQRGQRLDLVAVGIAGTEGAALEGQDRCPRGLEEGAHRRRDARIRRPERPGLRFGHDQTRPRRRRVFGKRGGEEHRLELEPPALGHDHQVERSGRGHAGQTRRRRNPSGGAAAWKARLGPPPGKGGRCPRRPAARPGACPPPGYLRTGHAAGFPRAGTHPRGQPRPHVRSGNILGG